MVFDEPTFDTIGTTAELVPLTDVVAAGLICAVPFAAAISAAVAVPASAWPSSSHSWP